MGHSPCESFAGSYLYLGTAMVSYRYFFVSFARRAEVSAHSPVVAQMKERRSFNLSWLSGKIVVSRKDFCRA
jgi:hypothetical protein